MNKYYMRSIRNILECVGFAIGMLLVSILIGIPALLIYGLLAVLVKIENLFRKDDKYDAR